MQVTTWARKKIKSFAKDLLTLHADAFQPPHAGASCCCKRAFLCLHCAEHKVLLCSSSPTVLGTWQLLRGQTSLQTACWITGVVTYPKNHAVDFISLRKKRKKNPQESRSTKKEIPIVSTSEMHSMHMKPALEKSTILYRGGKQPSKRDGCAVLWHAASLGLAISMRHVRAFSPIEGVVCLFVCWIWLSIYQVEAGHWSLLWKNRGCCVQPKMSWVISAVKCGIIH